MRASAKTAGFAGMQARFLKALLDSANRAPGGIGHANRFNIHRNNVLASLVEVLRAHFPVVARLVGGGFFLRSAREFIRTHPPATPVLLEYGEAFPEFLERFEPALSLPYLGDTARLEWLWHTAYHAADRKPLTAEALSPVPTEDAAGLTFEFHPSASLIASPYPIVSIWETNTFDAEVRAIGPSLGGEAALVIRPEFDVAVLRLDPGEYALAAALAQGSALRHAAAKAEARPGFALAPALAKLIRAGAFTGFTPAGRERRFAPCLV